MGDVALVFLAVKKYYVVFGVGNVVSIRCIGRRIHSCVLESDESRDVEAFRS